MIASKFCHPMITQLKVGDVPMEREEFVSRNGCIQLLLVIK